MSNNRSQSIKTILERERVPVIPPSIKISDFFGSMVFNEEAMKNYLSEEAFLSVMSSIEQGTKIDRKVADQVASSMKAWAIEKGATHYTHWFQPLTGLTAEKHDSFFVPNGANGIEVFDSNSLVQQEPDASSFPNGGIRSTFEARGYTAWDPGSPAFIREIGEGKTLCIPTIFVAYTGESLDYKAPLLRSQQALEDAAIPVCHYFDKHISKVTPTLGWEQEYFLIDEALYNSRPDLVLSDRTLFGHATSKGQQLDDHYFGSIPDRIYGYMREMEMESHKLGIPVRTRHNEVAPGQYECAPMFEELNIAVDHNQLLMEIMERVARKHKLKVLFHEKPFAGLNGSGKHNNWSLATDTGKNLLKPGRTPKTNLMFLTFFVNTIKAVSRYDDLIRASIASVGNEHRLGANEAPPAIISIFIGSTLSSVLDEIEKRVPKSKSMSETAKDDLKLDIHNRIPDLLLDNTDRNRTSPFAFTGNKFEVRAVGSTANCALPMTILNTAVADQLKSFKKEVDALIKKGEKRDAAILRILRKYITESKNILFEGDNYSDAWAKEAKKRGLSNVKDTPTALDFFTTKEAYKLFEDNDVMTKHELHARYEIWMEMYILKLQIEARVIGDISYNHIIPVAIRYQNELIQNIKGLKDIGMKPKDYTAQKQVLNRISGHVNVLKDLVDKMINDRKKANKMTNERKKAGAYYNMKEKYFVPIRYHADKLELLVDDNLWPLPKYREMLYVK